MKALPVAPTVPGLAISNLAISNIDFSTSFGMWWREKLSQSLDRDIDKAARKRWANLPRYRDNLWYEFSVSWGRVVKQNNETFSIP